MILIAVAMVIVCGSVVFLCMRLMSVEKMLIDHEESKITLEAVQKLTDTRINDVNKDIDEIDDQIRAILDVFEKITADIHRLNHDEKEIRKYYMNFREPVNPNGGVEWAGKIRSSEDL